MVQSGEPSLLKQGHPVAPLGLVEVGGGHDRGHPVGHHLVNDEPEIAARDGIHAKGRLVQQQHAWVMNEGTAE